jgi:hypothetical protein
MGLKKDRPKITRSNLVCAEPMPGEEGLLEEFLTTLRKDRLEQLIRRVVQVPETTRIRATESMADSLCDLVRLVWDKMKLAGEAGSLLKIEEELQEAIRKGQEEWEERLPLWRMTIIESPTKKTEKYVRYVPGEGVDFWQRAEALVMAALDDFSEYAANGRKLLRKLFVDDAVRGFAFIDVSRQRFDVVLMNPPFGAAGKPSKGYIDAAYPRTKNDVYAAFVEHGLARLATDGMLGAITSRTGFFLSSFQKWREEILLKQSRPTIFADLGYGVLDTAMVETAAYCLLKTMPTPVLVSAD